MQLPSPQLVLGSSSPYRGELLARLGLPFQTARPAIDEHPLPNESPTELVVRLAQAKAHAVARQQPKTAVVIGSDQVAVHQGKVLGKPHTVANAQAQLASFSGSTVSFQTGLAVYDNRTEHQQQAVVTFEVGFRTLTDREIDRYVAIEQPLDCAGAFKSEGLGIRLFRYMRGDDPSSLVGLPLIRLCDMLLEVGLDPLEPPAEESL